MASIPPIVVQVQAELSKFKGQMSEVSKLVKGVGDTAQKESKNVDSMAGSLKRLAGFAVGALAIRQLTQVFQKAGHEAVTDSKSFEMMARTVQAVTGASREQMETVDKQISKMAILSAVPDDKIRPAFTLMARNTKDVTKSLSMMQLALDVSAGTGKSLTAVSMAMARAMNGNSNALNRIVPEAKNVADKFGYMEKTFAGAAEAAANKDPYARMNVIFSEMYESIGYGLIPVLNQFADWLTDMLPKVQEFFKQLTDPTTDAGSAWQSLIDLIANLFNWITANIGAIIRWGMVLAGVWAVFKVGAIVVATYKTAVELAKIAQIGLNLVMNANPIMLVASAIAAVTAALIAYSFVADGTDSPNVGDGGTGNEYDDAIAAYDRHMGNLAKRKKFYEMLTPEAKAQIGDTPFEQVWANEALEAIPAIKKAKIAADKAYNDEVTRLQQLRASRNQKPMPDLTGGQPAPTPAFEKYVSSLLVAPESFIEKKLGRIESAVFKKGVEIQGKILEAINVGEITASAGSALSKYAEKEISTLSKIAKARDYLAERYNLAKTLMGSVKDTVKGLLSMDALGTTAESVVSAFTRVSNSILAFAKNIKTLKERGVATDFISQIASAGVESGGALAQGLSTAAPEQIKAINEAFDYVQQASSAASESIAQSVYGDGVDVTKGLLAGIISQDKTLLDTATDMGQRFAKTFAAASTFATTTKDDKAFAKAMAKWQAQNLPAGLVLPGPSSTSRGDVSLVNNYNVDVMANTNASPDAIAQSTVSAIKFGQPITLTPIGAIQ